jgi:hypothetical protein
MPRTEKIAQEAIQQWHTLAITGKVEGNNIFFQFMAAWVAFNALYNWVCKYEPGLGDKAKLLKFVRELTNASRIHQELLRIDNGYKEAVSILKNKGIRDVSKDKLVQITDDENFEEVILCVYQVRNNLFHGDKVVSNARDESVVRASFEIISKFMQQWLT